MATFVVLLRGINVSGQKLIKMADLRELLTRSGLNNVETYIQSGNIVCEYAGESESQLEGFIAANIRKEYKFEVPVAVRKPEVLQRLIEGNPFPQQAMTDPRRVMITFLSEKPVPEKVDQLKTFRFEPEEWAIQDNHLYFYFPDGYGKAKFNNNFIEQKLGVTATTRNWKTVNILAEMAQKR